MNNDPTQDPTRRSPVIPVVAFERSADAVPTARALLDGGVAVIEVTMRTSAALDAVRAILDDTGDMLVGVGTIRDGRAAERSASAGAHFLVSPGCTTGVLDGMDATGLPYLAGVCSPTEILAVLERGRRTAKFFPAAASGGRDFLTAMSGPFPELSFCPTGGIGPHNAADYLSLSNVACVGGGWLVPAQAIARGAWDVIRDHARASLAYRRADLP